VLSVPFAKRDPYAEASPEDLENLSRSLTLLGITPSETRWGHTKQKKKQVFLFLFLFRVLLSEPTARLACRNRKTFPSRMSKANESGKVPADVVGDSCLNYKNLLFYLTFPNTAATLPLTLDAVFFLI